MPYHPMKKHMEKLDEWGSQQSKKLVAGRDAGPSAGISDRFNLARGKDDRWNRYQQERSGTAQGSETASTAPEGEDPNNIVPRSSARAVPPPRPSTFQGPGASRPGAPPPPPARTASGFAQAGQAAATTAASSAASAAATAAASSAFSTLTGRRPAPPVLPKRMDNEAGIDKPPPPYISGNKPPVPPSRKPSTQNAPQASTSSGTAGLGAVEFSKFTQEQKDEFFALLDEFFQSRTPSAAKATGASKVPVQPVQAARRPVTRPSNPSSRASISHASSSSVKATNGTKTTNSWSYPRLGSSNAGAADVCSALQCASFFVYRNDYPEWSGSSPWYTSQNPTPPTLRGRNDLTWSYARQYVGSNHTVLGCATFSDLSCLWWKVSFDSNNPVATVQPQVAYKDRAEAWNDDERLVEASRGFAEWIAGFAEQAAQARQPIGDGECWTLAAEAIKYTNATAQLTEANRLLATIGRTHGHLLFAGKGDPTRGQCGRWRGGDRIRANGGGIRRGDIVEWRTVRIREKGAPRGSYSTLGAPDHTAVVVDNSPAPERLAHTSSQSIDSDYYALLGVRPTSSQAEIRNGYLQAARRNHPDRTSNSSAGDLFMQRLNAANATLSDPALRRQYDEDRGKANSGRATNISRVSATVDLDAMEIVEEATPLTFSYPCRCGGAFHATEDQLQSVASVVASCSGCSERIRIVADMAAADEEQDGDNQDSGTTEDQPEIAPWEFGSITVIEQSAGQVPTRRTYDLGLDSFTQGEMWVYRPVWECEALGGPVQPSWPPSLRGWQSL